MFCFSQTFIQFVIKETLSDSRVVFVSIIPLPSLLLVFFYRRVYAFPSLPQQLSHLSRRS